MARIANPILPGFHPDPCMLRVGDDVYLATSTFEWWPGVQLYHSRDLASWRLVGHALTRRSQLDMRGNPDSGGIWAPALSHRDGLFHLVYTDVKNFNGMFKDLANYLVTAPSIEGPWSEPVFLNRSGFDPSLFHDDDGRTWLLNQLWDHRPGNHPFAGIIAQEFDRTARRLVGEPVNIFAGSSLRITEGPHLYKRQGWYYLVTAEGGTGVDHAVTVARSRALAGPYEISPHHPLLTSKGRPELALQKAGHGSWIEMPGGRWFLAHLCGRPVGARRRCILGRETALQEFRWTDDGWPVLVGGGNAPADGVDLPVAAAPASAGWSDRFDRDRLDPRWNTLREPPDASWLELRPGAGGLRLRGRLSLSSTFDQSLVGTRLQHHRCAVETWVDFAPRTFQQMAGLALFYNTACYHYLHVTCDDAGKRVVQILTNDARRQRLALERPEPVPAVGPIGLRAEIDGEALRFQIATAPGQWRAVGPTLDASILSDEYPWEQKIDFGFTGTFVALSCQDFTGGMHPAEFSRFTYELPR